MMMGLWTLPSSGDFVGRCEFIMFESNNIKFLQLSGKLLFQSDIEIDKFGADIILPLTEMHWLEDEQTSHVEGAVLRAGQIQSLQHTQTPSGARHGNGCCES